MSSALRQAAAALRTALPRAAAQAASEAAPSTAAARSLRTTAAPRAYHYVSLVPLFGARGRETRACVSASPPSLSYCPPFRGDPGRVRTTAAPPDPAREREAEQKEERALACSARSRAAAPTGACAPTPGRRPPPPAPALCSPRSTPKRRPPARSLPNTAGASAHTSSSPPSYYPLKKTTTPLFTHQDYEHGPHSMNFQDWPGRKRKVATWILGLVFTGTAVPLVAVAYQQAKLKA
jgi:hypothetical protein